MAPVADAAAAATVALIGGGGAGICGRLIFGSNPRGDGGIAVAICDTGGVLAESETGIVVANEESVVSVISATAES